MAHEFSCCAFYAKCNYGRIECYFEETQPEKKENCRCYKIKHSQPTIIDNSTVTKVDFVEEGNKEEHLVEQLSLF